MTPLLPISAVLLLTAPLAALQQQQTLPRGFDTAECNSSSSFPFNSISPHIWQWHYDSEQFDADGPIIITEVYVRTKSSAPVIDFNFPSVELVMASSPTDYSVNGDGVRFGHASEFDDNLNPDATVVRAASSWTASGIQPQEWIPFGLDQPFEYDPTLEDDFVLQVRKCLTTTTWNTSIDGQSGGARLNGGNRYGNTSDCNAQTYSSSNNEFVPVILIEYQPALPTLAVSPMAVGQLAHFSIDNLDPAGLAHILWSTTGSGPTQTFLGPVDLSPPLQVSFEVYADLSGVLEFSTFVPASLAGQTFFCQAAATFDGQLMLTNSLAIPVN